MQRRAGAPGNFYLSSPPSPWLRKNRSWSSAVLGAQSLAVAHPKSLLPFPVGSPRSARGAFLGGTGRLRCFLADRSPGKGGGGPWDEDLGARPVPPGPLGAEIQHKAQDLRLSPCSPLLPATVPLKIGAQPCPSHPTARPAVGTRISPCPARVAPRRTQARGGARSRAGSGLGSPTGRPVPGLGKEQGGPRGFCPPGTTGRAGGPERAVKSPRDAAGRTAELGRPSCRG